MAFGNISIDPAAFAPQNGQNGLLSGLMMGAQMRAYQEDREQKQRDQEKEQALAGAMQGVDPNDPATFKPLYGINPLLAMKLETEAVERRKALSQEEAANQEKLRGAYTDWAKGFSNYWSQLPPEQRNPQTAHAMLGAAVNHYQTMNPQLARVLATAPKYNPQWLEHALQNGGFTDPYAQDQREIAKQAQLNQLPPNTYQQAQLEQQGRATQAELTNKGAERGNNLRKQFEGLEEVQTYKTIAPLMEGLKHSASLDNKAGDLGLIYGVARVLDPKGVVRESDAGLVGGTGAWFEDLAGQYNAVKGGARLSPEVRQKLLEMAYGKVSASKQAFDVARNQYAGIAARQGIAPEDMGFDAMQVQPPQQSAPQGGMSAPAMGQQQAYQEGQTAVNRQTGQRIVFRGGKWVPM